MKRIFYAVTVFAIAMGFMETAVVIYLRELIYPMGFDFPFVPVPPGLALTEILREASTIFMLAALGYIAGKNYGERFAWFIYSFAVWDIFYYVFLKVMLGWPESLMTWDILFLIPAVWTGPVITPIIVSLSMIMLAMVILYFSWKGKTVIIKPREWAGLVSGGLILVLAFLWDYSSYMLEQFTFREIFILPGKEYLFDVSVKYIPAKFNWFLFITGQSLIVYSSVVLFIRLRKKHVISP